MFEGVSNVFPFYLLPPDEVAKRVVDAIQQEEQLVIIPWRGNLVPLTKLLPTTESDTVFNMLGANNSMSDFKGRAIKMPGIDLSGAKK